MFKGEGYKRKKMFNFLFWFVFISYCILLFLVVFILRGTYRGVNLIPFLTIKETIADNYGHFGFANIVNIAMFIPIGVYSMLFIKNTKYKPLKSLVVVFGITLIIECLQFAFKRGAFDIDDIILNLLGGALGIFSCWLLEKLIKNSEKTKTIIKLLSLMIGLIALLWIVLSNL